MSMSRLSQCSPTSTKGARVVEPLSKPVGQLLQEKQAKLGAYEDEKLGIYHQQLNQMESVFEQARDVRTGLKAMYEERNKFILDSLAEIRADTDARTKVHNQYLKEISDEFDENLSIGNTNLLAKLKTDLIAAGRRYTGCNKVIGVMDEAIQKEAEECQENAIRETAALAARLQEHSENLEEQIVERKEMHDSYCTTLAEHFRVIREKLKVETAARKEHFVAINKTTKEDYVTMNEVRDLEDVSVREKMVALRKALQEQSVDRIAAQKSVTKDMMHYMDQFKEAIDAMHRAQEETTKQLNSVKKKTGFVEMGGSA
jgi:hypothetical protein